jgi:hypothetical protein
MRRTAQALRALAARRGIDLDALANGEPVLNPQGWVHPDPVGWRLRQAEALLAYELGSTFADARADHPTVADWVRQHRGDPTRLPWLTLMGATGVGKTWQACGVVREVALTEARANRRCRWRMVTHADLSDQLRPKPDQSHAYVLDRYEQADLLVLDDLGSGSLTDFGVEGTHRLLDYRYRRRLPTVITTNLSFEDLVKAFGARVPSRLTEGTVVVLVCPDRRLDMGEWLQ